MFYLSKTPSIIRRLFKNFIWCFSRAEKIIYLTFDDGPTQEITEWTLNELERFNAKATFFCIGKNIENHPEIFRKIINNGHSIGNHTHNHINGWKSDNQSYIENILKCKKSIQKFNNSTIQQKLFRPPYGKIKPSQVIQLLKNGVKIIMWDVLTGDFDSKLSKEKSLQNCIKNTENGSIIVFHDSLKAEEKLKYILPNILAHFSEKGYLFKRIVLQD